MNNLKLHINLSIWLLVLLLAVPTVVQFHHNLTEHSSNLFQKKGINQLENNISCEVLHHLFFTKSNLVFTAFEVFAPLFQKNIILNFNYLQVLNQLFFKISRGPPSLLI